MWRLGRRIVGDFKLERVCHVSRAPRTRTWSSSGAVDGLSLFLSLLHLSCLSHSGCRHAWKPQPTSLGVLAYAVKSRCMNQRLRLRRASGKS